jgi:hypothetical protein
MAQGSCGCGTAGREELASGFGAPLLAHFLASQVVFQNLSWRRLRLLGKAVRGWGQSLKVSHTLSALIPTKGALSLPRGAPLAFALELVTQNVELGDLLLQHGSLFP